MKRRLNPVLFLLFMLSGCTATARLYPVRGPLSTQTPVPVYVGKLTDGLHSGDFSAVLGNGEVFKGRWNLVARPNSPKDASASGGPSANSLSAEWDAVYGPGFYVAHVLGARLYGRAILKGSRGTPLEMEIYKPDDVKENTVGAIKGVAKDDKNNIYKIAF